MPLVFGGDVSYTCRILEFNSELFELSTSSICSSSLLSQVRVSHYPTRAAHGKKLSFIILLIELRSNIIIY